MRDPGERVMETPAGTSARQWRAGGKKCFGSGGRAGRTCCWLSVGREGQREDRVTAGGQAFWRTAASSPGLGSGGFGQGSGAARECSVDSERGGAVRLEVRVCCPWFERRAGRGGGRIFSPLRG